MGNSTVTELQFREILAPILLTVDRFWDLTDHLLLNIVWKYPFYDINIWNIKLFEFAHFYDSISVGNGITSENDCFFVL